MSECFMSFVEQCTAKDVYEIVKQCQCDRSHHAINIVAIIVIIIIITEVVVQLCGACTTKSLQYNSRVLLTHFPPIGYFNRKLLGSALV